VGAFQLVDEACHGTKGYITTLLEVSSPHPRR
jgi:hypothetical protein